MRRKSALKRLSIIFLAVWIISAPADTVRYVSDKLEVPLRTGKSRQHKILRMMPVGTKIVVLASDHDGYSKVKLADQEGWVLSRYLMDKPSASARLSKSEQQLAEMEIERTRITEKLRTLGDTHSKKEIKLSSLNKKILKLQQDNAHVRQLASKTISIANENNQLKIEIKKVQRELETGRQEVVRLKDSASKDWFLYGAVVAIIGILIGMVITRSRSNRRSSW